MDFSYVVNSMIKCLHRTKYHITPRSLSHIKDIGTTYTVYMIPKHQQDSFCRVPVFERGNGDYYMVDVKSVNQVIDVWPEVGDKGLVCFKPTVVISYDSTESMLFHEAVHLLSVGPYISEGTTVKHSFGIRRQRLIVYEDGTLQEVSTSGTYFLNEYFTDYVAGTLYAEIMNKPYETQACNIMFENHVRHTIETLGFSKDDIVFEYFNGGDCPACAALLNSYNW